MAQTPSPRDHDADANPDVSRKRPRLSEDNHSPVHIETLDLEEIGNSFVDAIEIEDDDNMPQLYSDDFEIDRSLNANPLEQVRHFREECQSEQVVDSAHVYQVSLWLESHLHRTVGVDHEVLLQRYLQDEVFFSTFGQACCYLLHRRGEPFDEILGTPFPTPKDILHQFFRALQILSTRFVQLLPDITNDKFSRRDSAQQKGGQHRVHALYYLHVLRALLVRSAHTPLLRFAHASFAIDPEKLARHGHAQFIKHGGTVESLVITFGNLARNARDVFEAWYFMDSILLLIQSFISDSGLGRHELDSMIDIVNCYLLPAIREKHPRALPDEFHAHVVHATSSALRARALFLDVPSVYRLYERFVKGDSDALLMTHQPNDKPSFDALWLTCQEEKKLLAEHICTAWTLQTEKSYLLSDIIDVRTCGISLLTAQLRTCYSDILEPNGPDHPLVQYTARFLRVNELTKYVFSAESHASLVGNSANIVCFLAVAQSYTDQETDILWEAVTNSAEVEFAKASCGVLRQVCERLDKDQLLYLARQYTTTPASRIGPDVIELLSTIFVKISTTTPADATQESKLASAFVSLEMLRHLTPHTVHPSTNLLRHRAMAELSKYVDFCADDRFAIYQTCIADLSARTEHGTTSAEVLGLFLAKNTTSTEVEKLLGLLPLDAAVNELCAFVQRVVDSGGANIYSALTTRFNLILLLMYLTPNSHEVTIEDVLFTFLFGELSLDMYAREEAWKVLTKSTESLHSAQRLLDRFLNDFVPGLNANLATPYVVEIILEPLKGRLAADALDDKSQLLAHPLWSALEQFALHSDNSDVNEAASTAICDLLFLHPRSLGSKKTFTSSQAHFVQDLVDKLCNDYSDLESHQDDVKNLQFSRGVYLLSTLLNASRKTHHHFQPPAETKIILVGPAESTNMTCFKMQVYSSERQAKVVEVQAHSSANMGHLACAIESFTGLAEHRMIIRGKKIDLESDAQLSLPLAGIQESSMVMISPKYTFDCDLSAILTSPGPIEQIITEQYHRIERLVYGPQEGHFPIAKTAYDFLRTLKPSRVARSRVTSADTTIAQLFSATRPYQTCHSLHVLECQLMDFAYLGVIDKAFIVRTVQHLVSFILEPNVEPYVLLQVFHTLKTFLCEHPCSEDPNSSADGAIFECPTTFVDRVLVLFPTFIKLVSEPRHDQYLPFLLRQMYLTLLEAFRKDGKVWTCFTGNGATHNLHGQLLLLDNDELAVNFSRQMFDFCKETSSPENSSRFYWSVIEATIPQALECIAWPNAVFDLALSLLHIRQNEEADLRRFIRSLVSYLWSHDHKESPQLPVLDAAITGLLRLLWGALCVLRQFKKPLAQHRLSIDIFERLLFPCNSTGSEDESGSQPLICTESREIAFDIVRMTCESPAHHRGLTAAAQNAMLVLTTGSVQVYPGAEEWVRAPMKCSGLINMGMTCYMNSLLQQLFANLQFRKFILNTPIVHEERQVLLKSVQHLFANMQGSSKPCTETQDLVKALEVQIENQEDVHGFFATFFSKLEENMPNAETKRDLAKFFTGKFVTQIKGACGHVSTQTEPFIDISITVKNKASLQESLNEFVQGEPMQGANKYRCLTCSSEEGEGRLVDAMKRTCLDDVPDNVTFCLKRFTFEAMMGLEGKANDRFDFPAEIDMAGYQRSHLQQIDLPVTPDLFELVGVIVHQGSLEFGHYWSYIRMGGSMDPSKWFLVEDKNVKQVIGGVREVQEQCFGGLLYTNGNERADNAYVLLYQRADCFHERYQVVERISGDERHLPLRPPHVSIPAELGKSISVSNDWQHRIAQLFDSQYASFVDWLLESATIQSAPMSGHTSDLEQQPIARVVRDEPTTIAIAQATASYVLHVIVCDPAGQKRLPSFAAYLERALEAIPRLTELLLSALTADHVAFRRSVAV